VHSVADAQAQVIAAMAAMPADRVALGGARGRVLAEAVVAPRPLPGFTNSAMDGFAARAADLPGRLPVVGSIAAGDLEPAALAPGTVVRIMTGAVVPAGADAIVMFEDAKEDGDHVVLPAATAGDHVRRAGEDVATGAPALAAGTRLGSGEIALLAALGVDRIGVARAPSVAIIATGDELVPVGEDARSGQVYDSSAHMLAAQVADAGGHPTYLGIGKDDRDALARFFARGLPHDVLITTGGVSAGDHDHVRGALADAGVTLDFWKVAMKPGKPFAFGRAAPPATTRVFALPGNPASSWVAFELFVRPALLAMQGAARPHRPRAPVVLPEGYQKQAGRAHYLRSRVARNGERLVAVLRPRQGSAMLTSLVGVEAILEIPADATSIAPGAAVEALLLEAV
jgi:molybdopterin molybdotransferase